MIRLFHISDLHFGAEDKAALDWFEAIVRAETPDAIVVTGDLTLRARPEEFRAASNWLKRLDRPLTIEPGNHDLPYFDLWTRFFAPYRHYRSVETALERPLELENLLIVPLKSTARFQWRLNWSKGRISQRSLQEAVASAAAASPGATVFAATHHPLVEPGTKATADTRGGKQALRALAAAGVQAVLTGHVHDPFDITHEVDGRPIRLIGAGTLSERTRDTAPGFNEIRIGEKGFTTAHRSA